MNVKFQQQRGYLSAKEMIQESSETELFHFYLIVEIFNLIFYVLFFCAMMFAALIVTFASMGNPAEGASLRCPL